ncbi:hypothetical protein [Paenibacillus alvei]|uniref:hypothetical protein n=1 Tax=Paenibacillus alvei TaxID=44250 RepID=UPI0013DD3243|nr:hypothetical protein [Paenibacillus alvei]NEZ44365.1 hypothetical protein [Paenibacillus alvei]
MKRTILMEHEDNLLVLIESAQELGGKSYKMVSYEIWTDRDKYEQNVPFEFVNGEQFIYCSNYATNDRDSMIQTFKKKFQPMIFNEKGEEETQKLVEKSDWSAVTIGVGMSFKLLEGYIKFEAEDKPKP